MADTQNINNFQYPTKRENFQSTRELSKLSCQESIYVRVEILSPLIGHMKKIIIHHKINWKYSHSKLSWILHLLFSTQITHKKVHDIQGPKKQQGIMYKRTISHADGIHSIPEVCTACIVRKSFQTFQNEVYHRKYNFPREQISVSCTKPRSYQFLTRKNRHPSLFWP